MPERENFVRLKGHPQWREEDRRIVARLFAIHLACHPDRLARVFGCTPRYVRMLAERYVDWELPRAQVALERLEHMKRGTHGPINLLREKEPAEV